MRVLASLDEKNELDKTRRDIDLEHFQGSCHPSPRPLFGADHLILTYHNSC
jgi:hypothetical protein